MRLTAKYLNNLQPTTKLVRIKLESANVYIEQRPAGYSLIYRYKSPVTFKYRFYKLYRFTYSQKITAKDIKNINTQVVILAGGIAKGKDPLEQKQVVKKAVQNSAIDKSKNITVNRAFYQYCESIEFNRIAENTQYGYIGKYNKHIKPVFGNKSVQSYTKGSIQLFLETKSAGTGHILHTIFRNIEHWLLKNDLIEAHRLTAITKKPIGKRRVSFTDEQVAELLGILDNNKPIHAAIYFQLLTGCCVNEVLKATWAEIDFKHKLWTIPWHHIKTERKSGTSRRPHQLPITSAMAQVLLLMKQYGTDPDSLIFKSAYTGNKIFIDAYNAVLHPFGGSSHILRKTVGTNILGNLKLGSMELKVILNHAVVTGSDREYLADSEQFLDRKKQVLTLWHKRLEQLNNGQLKARC